MPVAFGVRKDYEASWEPGVVAVGDTTVNLAELLQTGDGQVVVADDNPVFIQVLDEQPALKRVPIQSAEDKARAVAAKAERKRLNSLSAEELQKASEGLVAKSAPKKEHVDALVARYEGDWTPETVTGG